MDAYILCSKYIDQELKLGVCAYSLVFNNQTYRDNVRLSGVFDEVECELFGVSDALSKLKNITKKNPSVILDNIHFFSSDEETIKAMRKLPKEGKIERKLYQKHYGKIQSFSNLMSCNNKFHKVQVSVVESMATNIESSHNILSQIARRELNRFKKEIVEPIIKNTKIFGVILSDRYDKSKEKDMFQAGYLLALDGYKARIFTNEKFYNHPFIKGIKYYCKKESKKYGDIVEEINFEKGESSLSPEENIYKGCKGLDTALYSKITLKKIQSSKISYKTNVARRTAAITRTMFGHQLMRSKSDINPIKRIGPVSEFIVSFCQLQVTEQIIKDMSGAINYPIYKSVEELKSNLSRMDISIINNAKEELPRGDCSPT